MSLDIAILGADGSPKKQVSIDVNEHFRLMQIVCEKSGSLLNRLKDYYADAEFKDNELGGLIAEVTEIKAQCHGSGEERLLAFLNDLVELAEIAKCEQRSLIAIAD